MKSVLIMMTYLLLTCLDCDAATEPLTLTVALRMGMENSPALQAATKARDSARLATQNASSAFLPSIDITTTQRAGAPNGTSSWALSATESLWDHGTTWTALRSARLNEAAAELSLLEARETLAAQLAEQWFEVSRLEAFLEIQTEKASLIEKQFSGMKEQFEQGLKTREDYQRIRAQLLGTRADLISTRSQRDQTLASLLSTVGTAPVEATSLTIRPTRPPHSPTALWLALFEKQKSDLSQNPTLSRLQTEKLKTDLAPQQARYNYWPNIDISAAAAHGGVGPLGPLLDAGSNRVSAPEWSAGLTLSWNLWDWGILSRNVQVADLNRDQQQAELREQELELRTQAQQTAIELVRLKEESQLQSEVARMEEDNFRTVEDNYRRGRTSYLDLITALRDRSDARARWNSGYFSTLKTHVQLLKLEGKAHAWLLAFDEKFKNP